MNYIAKIRKLWQNADHRSCNSYLKPTECYNKDISKTFKSPMIAVKTLLLKSFRKLKQIGL